LLDKFALQDIKYLTLSILHKCQQTGVIDMNWFDATIYGSGLASCAVLVGVAVALSVMLNPIGAGLLVFGMAWWAVDE
jgi:hypothetical protein